MTEQYSPLQITFVRCKGVALIEVRREMPVTASDRPHNKQNDVEKRAVEGASPYNNIAEITPRHYKYHFADFSFAAFITFIRENSSLSFSSRESVMNFTMRSFLGMIMFCRAFALRCVFFMATDSL